MGEGWHGHVDRHLLAVVRQFDDRLARLLGLDVQETAQVPVAVFGIAGDSAMVERVLVGAAGHPVAQGEGSSGRGGAVADFHQLDAVAFGQVTQVGRIIVDQDARRSAGADPGGVHDQHVGETLGSRCGTGGAESAGEAQGPAIGDEHPVPRAAAGARRTGDHQGVADLRAAQVQLAGMAEFAQVDQLPLDDAVTVQVVDVGGQGSVVRARGWCVEAAGVHLPGASYLGQAQGGPALVGELAVR